MKFTLINSMCIAVFCCGAAAKEVYVEKYTANGSGDRVLTQMSWHSDFVVANNNKPFPYKTAFKAAYDDKYLYFYIKASEPQINKLKFKNLNRKGWPKEDSIELFLATKPDRKSYIQLAVGCNGTMYDSRMKNRKWNAKWTVVYKVAPDSWSCIIKIPFVDLGVMTPKAGTVWGFNICRNRKVTGTRESGTWAHVGSNFHNPGKFGRLIFGLQAAANLGRLKNFKIRINQLKKLQPLATPAEYRQKFGKVEKALEHNGNLDKLTKQINCLDDELQVIIAIDKFNQLQKKQKGGK